MASYRKAFAGLNEEELLILDGVIPENLLAKTPPRLGNSRSEWVLGLA